MTLDDIDTEARRLGELETAFIRVANEIVHLKNEMIQVNRELVDMATRLDLLENESIGVRWRAPWWRRWL